MSAMEGNGRELADVLDRAVPGEAVIEIGDNAEVNAVHAGLFEYILNNAALAGSGEKYLVDELLTGVLEERIESPNHIATRRHHLRQSAGEFNEALEGVSEVADALNMMAQRVGFSAGADDKHVACVLAAVKTAVHEG